MRYNMESGEAMAVSGDLMQHVVVEHMPELGEFFVAPAPDEDVAYTHRPLKADTSLDQSMDGSQAAHTPQSPTGAVPAATSPPLPQTPSPKSKARRLSRDRPESAKLASSATPSRYALVPRACMVMGIHL